MIARRSLLLTAGAAALAGASRASDVIADPKAALAAIEAGVGGRIGVAALDTGSGRRLSHRGGERFAMCSTFKLMLAALVLERVDGGELKLDQSIAYGPADLLRYAPVTRAHVADGGMRLDGLCAAAVEQSDNTAANLLLRLIGGPAGYTAGLRRLGDAATRLDRYETSLNTNLPGDPRDTSTPDAMVSTLRKALLGGVLAPTGAARLIGWMKACATGADRLRAGLPRDWTAGDKTGTGDNGAVNDLAITWPPGRKPILIVAYMSGSSQPLEALNAAQKQIGAVIASAFAFPSVARAVPAAAG
jgi:beta-lactamase class A